MEFQIFKYKSVFDTSMKKIARVTDCYRRLLNFLQN